MSTGPQVETLSKYFGLALRLEDATTYGGELSFTSLFNADSSITNDICAETRKSSLDLRRQIVESGAHLLTRRELDQEIDERK